MTPFLAGMGLGLSLIVAIGAQNVFVLRQGIRRQYVGLVALLCATSDAVLILVGVSGIGAATEAVPWLLETVRWVGAAFLVGYGVLAARRALRPSGEALVLAEAADPPGPGAGTDPAFRGTVPAVPGNRPRRPGEPSPLSRGTVPAVPGNRPLRPGEPSPLSRGTVPGSTATSAPAATAVSVALTCLALTWLNPHVYLDTVFLLGSIGSTHGENRWMFAAGATLASVGWFFSLAYGARLLGRWLTTAGAWRVLDAGIAVVMVVLGISLVA